MGDGRRRRRRRWRLVCDCSPQAEKENNELTPWHLQQCLLPRLPASCLACYPPLFSHFLPCLSLSIHALILYPASLPVSHFPSVHASTVSAQALPQAVALPLPAHHSSCHCPVSVCQPLPCACLLHSALRGHAYSLLMSTACLMCVSPATSLSEKKGKENVSHTVVPPICSWTVDSSSCA